MSRGSHDHHPIPDERDLDQYSEDTDHLLVPGRPISLIDFPTGTKAGIFFHAILEEMDFTAWQSPESEALIARKLLEAGYDVEPWTGPIQNALGEALSTQLLPEFTLADLKRTDRIDEMEFLLPVLKAGGQLSPQRLAAAFAPYPSDVVTEALIAQMNELSFGQLEGYLKGFIDLIFRHDGKYYVADYKSNHLGDTMDAYGARQMASTMFHSRYHLQALLYTVALHRYLEYRMPDYDYETHFGGIFYLFIKGMHPDNPPGKGVFFHRPAHGLISDLSDLFS